MRIESDARPAGLAAELRLSMVDAGGLNLLGGRSRRAQVQLYAPWGGPYSVPSMARHIASGIRASGLSCNVYAYDGCCRGYDASYVMIKSKVDN